MFTCCKRLLLSSNLISFFSFVFVTIGGDLLTSEKLLNEDNTGPKYAILVSLSMLVITKEKERIVMEYKQLQEKHGFVDFRTKQL